MFFALYQGSVTYFSRPVDAISLLVLGGGGVYSQVNWNNSEVLWIMCLMSYLWWYAFITLHLACLLTYIEKEVYNDTRLNESIRLHRQYRCKKPPFFRRNQLPYRRQQYRGRFSGTTYSSEIIGVTYKTGETLQDHQNSDTAA